MVKAKYKPMDTYGQHPRYMDYKFKKTTIARYYGDTKWYVIEDRLRIEEWGPVREDCERMVIFLQEPKYDRWGKAFFCSSP
eukprot:229895-Karenia_brevis.AAC.1